MMTETQIEDLLKRYKDGRCTPEEMNWVDSWYLRLEASATEPVLMAGDHTRLQKVWMQISNSRKPTWYRPAAAAAVVVLLASGIGFYLLHQGGPGTDQAGDIPAGSNKAVLVLANGREIVLTNAANGEIARQSGMTITRNSMGQLVYTASSSGPGKAPGTLYNTIRTPRGGQYQVVLPDGSRVYLNAASSLKYPVNFASDKREVALSGEGYFEISRNAKKPFIVTTDNQKIKVLGTHFNVTAYPNETIKTTLAEGSVELSTSSFQKQVLKPDEQAMLSGNGFRLKHVNARDEIAWKDGLFVFRQTPVAAVLSQLSRWYNVKADYSNLPDATVDAELSRLVSLNDLLTAINFTTKNKGFKIQLMNERTLQISKN